MLLGKGKELHPERTRLFLWAQRVIPLSSDQRAERLFLRQDGRWLATRLFLVLLVVELADVMFAVDSIPAVFGITRDPFIVYTSNVLAILGLRALYFLLAGVIDRLRFLDEGLAVGLGFFGGKKVGQGGGGYPLSVFSCGLGGVVV